MSAMSELKQFTPFKNHLLEGGEKTRNPAIYDQGELERREEAWESERKKDNPPSSQQSMIQW